MKYKIIEQSDRIRLEERSNASFLLITYEDKGKVFEIKRDGSVWYTVKGKYQEANTDKKLGIALGEAFLTMVKLNEETFKRINK